MRVLQHVMDPPDYKSGPTAQGGVSATWSLGITDVGPNVHITAPNCDDSIKLTLRSRHQGADFEMGEFHLRRLIAGLLTFLAELQAARENS